MNHLKKIVINGMIVALAAAPFCSLTEGFAATNNTVDATSSATQTAPPVQPKPSPTPPTNTVKTTKPVSTVTQSISTGTIYLEGLKDFRIAINEKMEVTSVYNYDQPKLTYTSSKGKSLKRVLATLKKELVTTKGTATFITIGLGSDVSNDKQKNTLNALLADTFKAEPLVIFSLTKTDSAKVKKAGPNHMLELALAASAEFSYKKSGASTFGNYAVLSAASSTKQDETDEDDNEDNNEDDNEDD